MFIYRFRLILQSFLTHAGLPFAQAFDEEGVVFGQDPRSVYTPAVTLWAFLSQVLFKGEQRSCVAAVSRVVGLWVALGREPCSDNTGAYCRARAKLPVAVIRRLTLEVAERCEEHVPTGWLWKGRHVYLVDGTTISMPDTSANQADYPQPTSQEPGLGFPLARMVVSLSLATGMVHTMAIGPYAGKETGETALLREMSDRFAPGGVVLGDRYYCSYFMVALFLVSGVAIVTRLHQSRQADFRRGTRLGRDDHLVEWTRPAKPEWMDQEVYDGMPATICVREVHVQVHQPGFRTRSFVVVTTLTDADAYTRDDLAELYHQRWLAELDIRAIKVTLGMDVLRCKTPEMVRREIWACLLAYNLIRRALLQAAWRSDRGPRQLSFTAALQKIAAAWTTILVSADATACVLIDVHLRAMALHPVGHRPGRIEPRAVKRRPKPQPLLMQPREQAREALLAGSSA